MAASLRESSNRFAVNCSKSTKLEYSRSFVKCTDNPLKIIIRRRRDSTSSNDETSVGEDCKKDSRCVEISESLRLCKLADELTNTPNRLHTSDTLEMIEHDKVFRNNNDESSKILNSMLEYEVSDEEELDCRRFKKKIPDNLISPHKRGIYDIV